MGTKTLGAGEENRRRVVVLFPSPLTRRSQLLAALGAGEENRTPDLLITSEPLCRLSYPGAAFRAPDLDPARRASTLPGRL